MVDIHAVLTQSPGQQLAFVPTADPQVIAETLTAFANAEGGTLVLGLSEDGRLGDIFVEDDAGDALQAALRLCRPPVRTDWNQQQVAGGTIVILRVERSPEMHSLVDGRVVVRKGTENVPADSAEITQLVASRPVGDFELQEVPGARRDDLDEDVIDNYLERRQKRNPRASVLPKDKLLQQIGALTDQRTPTVSGLLLFGKEPQLFLPQSR